MAVLPVSDATGTADPGALTSTLRGSVVSAVAAEADTDTLRYVAEGVARTTVTGVPGSRLVSVEIQIYASGDVRRGQATENEATDPGGVDGRLRAAVVLAFRRAAAGWSIVVSDTPSSS